MGRRSARQRSSFGFRPEIEGLRAFAVLLVVADHLGTQPHGGFIGVDVFFVISGFLITGLLLNEYARKGRISIRGFYQRRARRILPASLLVLGATALTAKLLFLSVRAHQTFVDILWSLCFAANIHFARIGTNYFEADRPQSPVQHYWSLAVEEQFYLFWPVILIVLLWLGHRISRGSPRRLLIPVTAIGVAGLFVWSFELTKANSSNAYFVTPARAWELGVGALLAITMNDRRIRARLASICSLAGLLIVLVSSVVIKANTHFPAPTAALPVLGAALVIFASASPVQVRTAAPLTNPLARYIGRISYSLYLWHWPVIIFVQSRFEGPHSYFVVICLLLMAALSVASFHFVEDPLRRFKWSTWRRQLHWPRSLRRAAPQDGQALSPGGYAGLAAVCCAVLAFVVWQSQPFQARPDFAVAAPAATSTATTVTVPFGQITPSASLSAEIDSALQATHFPSDLTPSLAELPNSKVSEWSECGNVNAPQLAGCTFPGVKSATPKSVAVLGDSIGITWLPMVRGLQAQGYTVYGLTYGECPAPTVDVKPAVGTDATFTRNCDDHRTWAIQEIGKLDPTVVVMANSLQTIDRLSDGATGAAAYTEWQNGTVKTANAIQAVSPTSRLVLISPPPPSASLQTCAPSTSSDPSKCVGQVSDKWYAVANAERTAAQQVKMTYLDVHLLFCAVNNYCPAFIGTMPVRVDGEHLSEVFSQSLAPVLDPLITGAASAK